jgi:hypothetical protein
MRNAVTNEAVWAFNMAELRWLFGFAVTGVTLQFLSVWWRFSSGTTTETPMEGEHAGTASIQQATNRA